MTQLTQDDLDCHVISVYLRVLPQFRNYPAMKMYREYLDRHMGPDNATAHMREREAALCVRLGGNRPGLPRYKVTAKNAGETVPSILNQITDQVADQIMFRACQDANASMFGINRTAAAAAPKPTGEPALRLVA